MKRETTDKPLSIQEPWGHTNTCRRTYTHLPTEVSYIVPWTREKQGYGKMEGIEDTNFRVKEESESGWGA